MDSLLVDKGTASEITSEAVQLKELTSLSRRSIVFDGYSSPVTYGGVMGKRKQPPVVVEKTERICSYHGCVTILSATNDDPMCRCHQSKTAKEFIARLGVYAESRGVIAASGRNLTLREARRTRSQGFTEFRG